MNDRIRQLAEQAGEIETINVISYDGGDTMETVVSTEFNKEKFAELIVRECAKKCDEFGDRLEDERPNTMLGDIAWECADGIKRMFGIEE